MPAAAAPGANPGCLFIQGSDSGPVNQGGRTGLRGNNDLNRLIGGPDIRLVQFTADILKRSALPVVTRYSCLINQISDADLNRRMLEHLSCLLSDYQGRIINRPSDVLKTGRDGTAALLAGTPGMRVPRVARLRDRAEAAHKIERAGLSWPILLRRAGTHGGKTLGLFTKIDDLLGAIQGDGDLFATEFADFRSADGLYRKYRVCMIGQWIILRHMIAAEGWNIHGRERHGLMLARPDLREEEQSLLARPREAFSASVVDTLKAVRKRSRSTISEWTSGSTPMASLSCSRPTQPWTTSRQSGIRNSITGGSPSRCSVKHFAR